MTTFEFSYVVSGIDPHSDNFEDVFFEAGCDDATLMLHKGGVVAAFARESESYADAVVTAYSNLLTAGATIERFDPDFLVTQTDIAVRANISRQAVTNYVKGDRCEGFPAPSYRVMSPSPLWDWVDVSDWLCRHEIISRSIFKDALISRGVNMFIEQASTRTPMENVFHQKIEREAVLVA